MNKRSVFSPESIDLAKLPSVPLECRRGLPSRSGIYFAVDSEGNIHYIGRAEDLRCRWKSHHQQDVLESLGQIKLAWLEVQDPILLREIEAALINWFNPPLNKVFPIVDPEPVNTSSIVIRVKQVREAKGLSQNELARQIGMSLGNVQKIECNKVKSIPFDTLDSLCDALDCEVGDLLVRVSVKNEND